jgi:twitching motility protein PilJ
MKGHINSILWWAVGLNAVVLCVVLGLAYGAGARSSGLSLRDFTILPPIAGFELLGAAFFVIAITVFLFVWLDNKVQKRVTDLVEYAERLDSGDFAAQANVTADDFGVLAESFNRASEKLARIAEVEASREAIENEIADVEKTLVQLGRGELGARLRTTVKALLPVANGFNFAAESLARRLERVRISAGELVASANQAQSGVTTCAAAIARSDEELSATVPVVDQLAVMGRKVSVDADGAAEAARRALDFAEQGNRAVRDAADGMERIRASMQATAAKIKSLGDRSLEIYEIINIIQETNLLALSAVLEASRGSYAGPSGREAQDGVSGHGQSLEILAAELRKLADHSRGATREIVTLLKSIQAESNDAVVVMEQANRTAENGARLTEHAGKAFTGISTLLRQTADLALTISGASRQQAKDIDAAKTTIGVQAQAAHRNAARSNDALTQAEQVTRLCEQLSQALAQFRSGPAVVKAEAKVEAKAEITSAAVAGD